MKINDNSIYEKANKYLKELYDSNFKEGQYEAIESVVLGKRTLVVQKTGWGKSLVYFIATKILKEHKNGITIVVSPLLSLMENQLKAARKLNLNASLYNSTVSNKEEVLNDIDSNNIDLLLITPESLFTKDIMSRLFKLNIMCFVIDEAHCISDWGHDFRLEYSKLNKIVNKLNKDIPILATTATANNRVINDIKDKLSTNLHISRGSLNRSNIAIQIIDFKDTSHRYAWLLKNLNKFPGTGIIYCLTQRDCEKLSNFLNNNNYKTLPYHSGLEENVSNLKQFEENKIKALVSTIKLGMGYDKDNVSFVIHYQHPQNIISYYQQIGRAGRNIPSSYAVLMNDKHDVEILNSFIDNAFVEEETIKCIYDEIKNGNNNLSSLTNNLNYSLSTIKKALMFLEKDEFVLKDKAKYFIEKEFFFNKDHYVNITNARRKELSEFDDYLNTNKCYSEYITNSLDDFTSKPCGVCNNCTNENILDFEDYQDKIENALVYLKRINIEILPKKQYPDRKKLPYILNKGICLSRFKETGYGAMSLDLEGNKEQLLEACFNMLKPIILENKITHITSINNESYASNLAELLNVKYVDLVVNNKPNKQSLMENSIHQFENAKYDIKEFSNIDKIVLFDTFMNSGWTLTSVGIKLMEKGIKEVTPFVIASKSKW